MQTALFNPFARILCEEAQTETTPPGETETPAPAETDALPPAAEEETTFDFNADPENENPDDKDPDETDEQEYTLELPDDFEASDDFRALATEQAKAAGLDGKAAGKYVSSVITAMQQAEEENIKKSTQELKGEWGKDFNANMAATKQFTAKLRAKSGLTDDDLAPLRSPKGFKLLHALMTTTGESPFVGGKTAAPARNNADEARAMLTDPSHPDYKALDDPSHPLHQEANRKYNKLVGLS